ncbi:MAG: FAD-binding and (Fe-S)-binding domain-containing protein [Vicinamibacterales bacterium]
MTGAGAADVAGLARALDGALDGEAHFDDGWRALYATDASNYRHVPLGVVRPRGDHDVATTLAAARRHRVPVFARGGGTSLAGQTCNEGLVLDFSRHMHRIESLDPEARVAVVQPGTVLDDLRRRAAPHGLTFGPDPATHGWCTLGGMIGNNSCGVRSVLANQYGPGPTTAHSVEWLDIITVDGARMRVGPTSDDELAGIIAGGGRRGEIYGRLRDFQRTYADLIRREFPDIPRRVSGYNLPALLPEHGFHVARALVGSESTLALVLRAQVTLVPSRPARALVVAGFPDVIAAADRVPALIALKPVGLEGLDSGLIADLRQSGLASGHWHLLPDGGAFLFVEFGDDSDAAAREQADACAALLRESGPLTAARVVTDPRDQAALWEIRESGLAATARVSDEHRTWPGWEDSAVPPERLGEYLRDLRRLLDAHGYRADLYGHFGQGCVHCRIDFDLETPPGIARFRSFVEAAADLVRRYGGSLSGEHGDGQARSELLPRMFSPEMLGAFHAFKDIWDPAHLMNPRRIVDARPLDADLRGTQANAPAPATWFAFPEDRGSFARATGRCVGVGKCRKTDAGTMCPSYMVTGEERHSTRGRARLLFEMLEGRPMQGGWQAEGVRDALDLCLACKGCKGECPVHVDMATYKAEFLSHYYEHHLRPRSAHAFGRIGTWARLVARLGLQRFVNTAAAFPPARALLRAASDMAPARTIPAFAPRTFRQWFAERRPPAGEARPPVLLWPDTFNDHFHPDVLEAATLVLEHMGFHVRIPPRPLCCGRPLYDYGLLEEARRHLRGIMDALADDVRAGTPLVGLEPGCVSVFRDELANLFPGVAAHERPEMLTFAEFLDRHGDRLASVRLDRRALVHGHCHHKALVGDDCDRRVLARAGVRAEFPDAGCCGMAGSFGFEAAHYETAMAVGERVLLPAVRSAAADTLVVADGFSCREQIAQATDRRALHLAQVVRMAIEDGPSGPVGERPERRYAVDHAHARLSAREVAAAGLVTVGLATAGVAAWRGATRRRGGAAAVGRHENTASGV